MPRRSMSKAYEVRLVATVEGGVPGLVPSASSWGSFGVSRLCFSTEVLPLRIGE